jgi:hypothetical protein
LRPFTLTPRDAELIISKNQLRDQLDQCERLQEQSRQDLVEMSTQLQTAIAQRLPSPAAPQPNIAQDNVKDEISLFVQRMVKEMVEPLISSIHEHCKSTITEYKESTYQEFWDKVSGPLKMSESITLILDAKGFN